MLQSKNTQSRNILFVAMCRSFGIPARIDLEYAQVQVKSNAQLNWQTINFDKKSKEIAANATLKLIYQNPAAIELQYGLNFSIAKISNGIAQTINFENNPIFSQFPANLSLTPGNYIIITGNRLSDGTVCSNIYPVTLTANQSVMLPMELFIPKAQNKMLGSIDATHQVQFNHQNKSIASFKNENGLAILCLDLPAEPLNVVKEDPKNENIIYIGTDNGVYASFDMGKTFMGMFGKNLPRVPVHDIAIQQRDNEIIIGTHGRSIYVAKLDEVQKAYTNFIK